MQVRFNEPGKKRSRMMQLTTATIHAFAFPKSVMAHAPVTPLLRFLRALTPEQREQLAQTCGTTVIYLYQLAAAQHPNPRVRLALAICAESRRLSRRAHSPPLKIDDLLVGTADPNDA
jgi:hypothetical protein